MNKQQLIKIDCQRLPYSYSRFDSSCPIFPGRYFNKQTIHLKKVGLGWSRQFLRAYYVFRDVLKHSEVNRVSFFLICTVYISFETYHHN